MAKGFTYKSYNFVNKDPIIDAMVAPMALATASFNQGARIVSEPHPVGQNR